MSRVRLLDVDTPGGYIFAHECGVVFGNDLGRSTNNEHVNCKHHAPTTLSIAGSCSPGSDRQDDMFGVLRSYCSSRFCHGVFMCRESLVSSKAFSITRIGSNLEANVTELIGRQVLNTAARPNID